MRDLIKKIILEFVSEERIFWTKEMVLNLAKNYSKMNDFKRNEPKAYNAARKYNWISDIKQFMIPAYEDWSDVKKIYQEASKYETLKDFREQSPKAYASANYRGILDDLKKHLKPTPFSVPTLTPHDVEQESLKYDNRKDFRTKSPLAYRWAIKYKLFGNTINHLGNLKDRKPAGYWDYEKLKDESLKYKTKKEFSEKNKAAVSSAKSMGIWDEITAHMEPIGNLINRAVYAWEFPDKSVYIGLTFNLKMRGLQHLDEEGKTQVSKHIRETKTTPIFKLISNYVPAVEAQDLESCSIEDYKVNGWKILNIKKAGGLGSCKRTWTYDNLKQEANKYDNVGDFKNKSHSAYVSAQKYGYFDELTKHMSRKTKTYNEYEIKNVASKYSNFTDFYNNEKSIYHAARKLGIIDDITKNMKRSLRDTSIPKFNNPEEIRKEFVKYKSLGELRKDNVSLYNAIRKFDMLDEVRSYFNIKPKIDWTLDLLKSISSQYKNKGQLQKYNPAAYQQARKKNYLDILFPKQ